MCVSCATAALQQVAKIGAGAAHKPTELIGAVSLVTLAGSVVWLLDPRRALHKVNGVKPGASLISRVRHVLQALWHLLLLFQPLRRQ